MNLNATLLLAVVCAFGLGAAYSSEPESATESRLGTEPYIGEIMWVPYHFEPRGWAFCNGQLLAIEKNQALFSLLGTTYGGDGRKTFGLPDLRGRMPLHAGEGPGLDAIKIGQKGGTHAVTLTQAQMPSHSHTVQTSSAAGADGEPSASVLTTIGAFSSASPTGSVEVISEEGGGQAQTNMPPYLGLHAVISLEGVYPVAELARPGAPIPCLFDTVMGR